MRRDARTACFRATSVACNHTAFGLWAVDANRTLTYYPIAVPLSFGKTRAYRLSENGRESILGRGSLIRIWADWLQ